MSKTTLARLACDERTAKRIADVISERLESAATAVAAFEDAEGGWNVELHFDAPPDEAAVRALVVQAGGAAAGLRFETIEPRDWVAASLADLKPVAAGRFTVHGAHDRARLNGVAPLVRCLCARGLTSRSLHARAPFDLVLANILLAPLTRLAAAIRHLLTPRAIVVLSGLLAAQENAALAAYRPHGLKLV